MLKDSSGRYTPQHVQRSGRLAGPMGREMDRLFAHDVAGTYVSSRTQAAAKESTQKEQVREFITLYKTDELVTFHKKRFHSKYPRFEYSLDIKNPTKLKEALLRHSKRRDETARIYPLDGEAEPDRQLGVSFDALPSLSDDDSIAEEHPFFGEEESDVEDML